MNDDAPLIRNISDTALWVAYYRAVESDRPDRVFDDPFARRLAGQRGKEIVGSSQFLKRTAWPFIARTWLIDRLVYQHVQAGFDTIVNLAAGLDSRPYRLNLPASLQWIEVDLPDILRYKEEILRHEEPRCQFERIPLDLSQRNERRDLFRQLANRSRKALVITEGLLIYLAQEEVIQLTKDLHEHPNFQRWVMDLSSPGVLKLMQRQMGKTLDRAKAPFKFAPEEGPQFFEQYQWKLLEVHSMFKTAVQLNRMSWFMKLMAMLPRTKKPKGQRPWSGVCLFERVD